MTIDTKQTNELTYLEGGGPPPDVLHHARGGPPRDAELEEI